MHAWFVLQWFLPLTEQLTDLLLSTLAYQSCAASDIPATLIRLHHLFYNVIHQALMDLYIRLLLLIIIRIYMLLVSGTTSLGFVYIDIGFPQGFFLAARV